MRYGNDAEVMNKLYSGYRERLDEIRDVATKFKVALFNHYDLDTMSFDDLLRKAKKYQKVYNISSDEFKLFLDLAMNDKRYAKQMEHMLPNSAMAATLGISSFTNFSDQLNVGKSGMPYVQKILELYAATASKHRQVVIQSFMEKEDELSAKYEKLANSIDKIFDDKISFKFNKYQHIHPVLVAMFMGKIEKFEHSMIRSNIGNIIKCKVEGTPIRNQPDYDLHWAMVSDPNDINCDISNPMEDIYKRFTLQTEIWNAVSNLREGKFYYAEAENFISALQSCRSNVYDVPELAKILDETTIMRKIMGAFSMRPFVTRISPFEDDNPNTIMGALATYTTVPIINVRLQKSNGNLLENALRQLANANKTKEENKFLEAMDNQYNWFIDNGRISPKIQTVAHIGDVAVFHVHRRKYGFDVTKFIGAPNQTSHFDGLPTSLMDNAIDNNYDNDPIGSYTEFEKKDIGKFGLRSVVYPEITDIKGIKTGSGNLENKEVIVGTQVTVSVHDKQYTYSPMKTKVEERLTKSSEPDKINKTATLFIFERDHTSYISDVPSGTSSSGPSSSGLPPSSPGPSSSGPSSSGLPPSSPGLPPSPPVFDDSTTRPSPPVLSDDTRPPPPPRSKQTTTDS
jgi:hypothetical protein